MTARCVCVCEGAPMHNTERPRFSLCQHGPTALGTKNGGHKLIKDAKRKEMEQTEQVFFRQGVVKYGRGVPRITWARGRAKRTDSART